MYSQYPRVVDLIISALLAAALGLTIWAPTFARDNAIKVVAAVSGGSFSPVFDVGTSGELKNLSPHFEFHSPLKKTAH
jgi:hypothetical protein